MSMLSLSPQHPSRRRRGVGGGGWAPAPDLCPSPQPQVLPRRGGARVRGAAGGGEGVGFPWLISEPASLARCLCGPVPGEAREPGAAGKDAAGPRTSRPAPPVRLNPRQG